MRTLYLLRHAKSSWDDPGLRDHERPLAPRGRRDAALIAEHLRSTGSEPELVLCSTAARTRETLELIRPALGKAKVRFEAELYMASSDGLLARVRGVPDGKASVMLIGHNPSLEVLALDLAADGDGLELLEEKFPTCALATLTFESKWSRLAPGGATLAAYVVPRELR